MYGGARVRVNFERVRYSATKTLPCPSCAKKVRRQRTFVQTINPYNLNADGQPASRPEIVEKLRAEAKVWRMEPEHCTSCFVAVARQRHAGDGTP